MNIVDRITADEYNTALAGQAGARAKWVANVTDRLMGELVKSFEEAGLKFPGDDRCFNVEVAVFKAAIDANRV